MELQVTQLFFLISDSTLCLSCKKESTNNLLLNDSCTSFCPFSFFAIPSNNMCKQCSTVSCDKELPRTVFSVNSETNTRYVAQIDRKIYLKTIDRTGSRRLQESEGDKINYCTSRIKGLKEGVDYTRPRVPHSNLTN